MKRLFASGIMVVLCAHQAMATPAPGFSFTLIDDLPGGAFFGVANGVSRDGTTVVGQSDSANGPEGFIWRAQTGTLPLGDLPGAEFASSGRAVSADGSIVAGNGRLALEGDVQTGHAFRWTVSTGPVDLGSIPPTNGFSNAWGMSGDGRFITGTASSLSGFDAFVWDNSTGVMTSIGAFEGRAISDDGSVVSTIETMPGGVQIAARWTAGTGNVSLGVLEPAHKYSDPAAMTPDGSTIVGWSAPVTSQGQIFNPHAFAWTEAGGMVALPSVFPVVHGWINQAAAISADGSVIVGYERLPGDDEQFAVIWDAALGAVKLQTFLESHGIEFEGYELITATGISGDGRTIVGTAVDPFNQRQAYIVTIPSPPAVALLLAAGLIGAPRRRVGPTLVSV